MSSTAPETMRAAKPQRHKVTGDVHLLLRRGNEVLFGRRRNTGFAGIWTDRREIVSDLGRCVANNVRQESISDRSSLGVGA